MAGGGNNSLLLKRAVSQVRGFLNWERLVFLEKNEEDF
jgi:hypothetical protein